MKPMKLWVARDADDTLCAYRFRPIRKKSYGIFDSCDAKCVPGEFMCVQLPKSWFPNVTWQTGPKRVIISWDEQNDAAVPSRPNCFGTADNTMCRHASECGFGGACQDKYEKKKINVSGKDKHMSVHCSKEWDK